jgi:hypothetical protein
LHRSASSLAIPSHDPLTAYLTAYPPNHAPLTREQNSPIFYPYRIAATAAAASCCMSGKTCE